MSSVQLGYNFSLALAHFWAKFSNNFFKSDWSLDAKLSSKTGSASTQFGFLALVGLGKAFASKH